MPNNKKEKRNRGGYELIPFTDEATGQKYFTFHPITYRIVGLRVKMKPKKK